MEILEKTLTLTILGRTQALGIPETTQAMEILEKNLTRKIQVKEVQTILLTLMKVKEQELENAQLTRTKILSLFSSRIPKIVTAITNATMESQKNSHVPQVWFLIQNGMFAITRGMSRANVEMEILEETQILEITIKNQNRPDLR